MSQNLSGFTITRRTAGSDPGAHHPSASPVQHVASTLRSAVASGLTGSIYFSEWPQRTTDDDRLERMAAIGRSSEIPDVDVLVGDEVFHSHREILSSASDFFA